MYSTYTKLSTLLFYRWRKSWKVYLPIYIIFSLVSLLFLYRSGNPVGWIRYETYYSMRPCIVLFLVALGFLIGYSLITLIWMQRDVKQIHRFMILPKARFTIILSEVLMNACAISVLLLLHYALFYIGYRHYMTLAPFYDVANGLILAITRSSFLRYIFPLTLPQWFTLIMSIMMASCIPAYIGLFYRNLLRCVMAAIMIGILVYVWLFPAGLMMNAMRIVQIALLFASCMVIVYDMRKGMQIDAIGG